MSSAFSYTGAFLKAAAKAPVHLYRYAISPLLGPRCRHLPTCSQYALDAIGLNGAWIVGWLALGRIGRCHPWGTHGYDPAPDLTKAGIPFWAPWRYLICYPRQEKPKPDNSSACENAGELPPGVPRLLDFRCKETH